MDSDTPELPINHVMYLEDLANNIRDIDERVFHSIGKQYCEIILLNEFPGPQMPGTHVANLVSFSALEPISYSPSVLMFPVKQECYIIWSTNVLRKLNYMLKGEILSGIGDKDLKQAWFMFALALARLRVLAHADEWFKGAKLRTKKSMFCHRELFTENGDEVGALRRLLSELDSDAKSPLFIKNDAVSLDIYCTLRLVSQALEHGRSLDDALKLVIYD